MKCLKSFCQLFPMMQIDSSIIELLNNKFGTSLEQVSTIEPKDIKYGYIFPDFHVILLVLEEYKSPPNLDNAIYRDLWDVICKIDSKSIINEFKLLQNDGKMFDKKI